MADKAQARVTIMPTMRYRDAPAAIEWLERAFGFSRHMVVPGADGMIAHAEMSFGNGMIMLGSVREDGLLVTPPGDSGLNSQSAYVVVDDADALYERAKGAGAEIIRDIQDTPYGSREFSCRDPEKQIWTFGTYDPFAGGG